MEPANDNSETASHSGENGADALSQPAERPLVFISYRISPDQPLADAVSRLIGTSIDPEPEVFVSGAGGLKPSAKGFKPQLQDAVHKARAFVGIITPASREREWIFYEAGAAWGRGRVYAPLLIGTAPDDLPSSIADFQAVHANRKDEVRHLIQALANATGGVIRPRFTQRYQAFERALNSSGKSATEVDESEPLIRAMGLASAGDTEAAKKLFDQLLETAGTSEDRTRVRIAQIISERDATGLDLLSRIEDLHLEHHSSACYLFWTSLYEPVPSRAIKTLKELVAHSDATPYYQRQATAYLAKRQAAILDHAGCLDTLLRGVASTDRELRSELATSWALLRPNDGPLIQLLVVLAGLTGRRTRELLRIGATICENAGWSALRLWFAHERNEMEPDGTSHNELGRAYNALALNNLAYEAYAQAAGTGIAVAKSNMAALLCNGPVAAAGLRLVAEHTGAFNAGDPGMPHQVRAEAERALSVERDKVEAIRTSALAVVALLSDVASRVVVPERGVPHRAVASAEGVESVGCVILDPAASSAALAFDSKPAAATFTRMGPLTAWEVQVRGDTCGIVSIDEGGALSALNFGSLATSPLAAPTRVAIPNAAVVSSDVE